MGSVNRQCPLLSVIFRWDVAPGSRAWKALSRARLGPAPTPNWEVRADLHEPWLTARDRSCPFARACRMVRPGPLSGSRCARAGLGAGRPNLSDHLAGPRRARL